MAIMNGPDTSNWQGSLNLNNINYDFEVNKATEGNTYVDPACDTHYQEAKAKGKRRGVYHFYDFNVDPITQANFFVDNCLGYVGDAILALDWEGAGVDQVGNAKAFLDHVFARTGVKPVIYMSEWVENNYDWSSVVGGDYGLWIAKYSNWELNNHAHDWDMSNAGAAPNVVHWDFYIMWQWTSTGRITGYAGNLDCDIFYGDGSVWDAYAKPHTANPAPQPQTVVLPPTVPVPVATVPATPAPAPDPAPATPPAAEPATPPVAPDPAPATPTPPVDTTPAPTPAPGTVVTPTPPAPKPTPSTGQKIDVVVTKKGNTVSDVLASASDAANKVAGAEDAAAAVVADVRNVKSGYKTTEFWKMLAVDVASLTGGLFGSNSKWTQIASLGVVLTTTIAYIWARSSVKKAALSN